MTETERELKFINSFHHELCCIREACDKLERDLEKRDDEALMLHCLVLPVTLSDLADICHVLANIWVDERNNESIDLL